MKNDGCTSDYYGKIKFKITANPPVSENDVDDKISEKIDRIIMDRIIKAQEDSN